MFNCEADPLSIGGELQFLHSVADYSIPQVVHNKAGGEGERGEGGGHKWGRGKAGK